MQRKRQPRSEEDEIENEQLPVRHAIVAPPLPSQQLSSCDRADEAHSHDGQAVPDGDEERGIISTIDGVKGAGKTARHHPGHGSRDPRMRWRTVAQRPQ